MLRFPYLEEPLIGSPPPSLATGALCRWRPLIPVTIIGPSGRSRQFLRALVDYPTIRFSQSTSQRSLGFHSDRPPDMQLAGVDNAIHWNMAASSYYYPTVRQLTNGRR